MNTPIIIPLTPVTLTSMIISFFSPKYQLLEAPDEKVSVVIPAYNEEKNIIKCLGSVAGQTKKPAEIIISNNGSIDSTKTTIDDYLKNNSYTLENIATEKDAEVKRYKGNDVSVVLIDHKNKTSKSDSISFAKQYIKSPRITIVDSDTYFLEDFIKEASKCFFTFYKPKKNGKDAVVEKVSTVCGTVLSNYRKEGGWQEKLISRARTLEFNVGQYLIKLGQNHLAVYVVSGCGFIADKELLSFDSKTVTEDLNFTWKSQCSQKKDTKLSLEELASLNLYTLEGKSLNEELKEFDGRIIFRDKGKAIYQPSAFMVTQDPQTFKGLMKQLERWKGGYHQNFLLEGKEVRKKNKVLALITHAPQIEGTLSSLYCYGLPISTGLTYAFNLGVGPEYPIGMMALDAMARTLFAATGTYRCNKSLKEKHPLLKTAKQTVVNFLPYYMIEFFNSYQFLKTQAKTAKEAFIDNRKEWDTSWDRIKDIEKSKNS